MLDEFVAQSFQENVNFMFWWHYMELVSILLIFTRAQRERGDMGPVIDHLNYVRWGSVYISEMNQLPKEGLEEFKKGDFVVKWNENKFNKVSPDHSLE